MTYGELIDRLVELGVGPPTLRMEHAALLDEDVEDVVAVIGELGVAVYVEGLDGREVGSAYMDVIRDAAALSGVVITDVAFDSEAMDDQLSFRIDGRPVTWPMDAHGPGDWIYSWSYIWGQINMLAPGGDDPREFYSAYCADPVDGHIYVLVTKEQAEALQEEFGVDFDSAATCSRPAIEGAAVTVDAPDRPR